MGLASGMAFEAALGLCEMIVLLACWLIGFHVVAASYHRWLKDRVWNTLVVLWKESQRQATRRGVPRGGAFATGINRESQWV